MSFLFFLTLSAASFLLAVLVDPLAFCGLADNHQVCTAGDGTGGVQPVAEIDHRAACVDALLFKGLSYLVANGIENDRGMVKVPLHHSGGVPFPPLLKVAAVVVGILAVVPHIEGFVHHVHAKPVAGIQQGFGGRVVGGADGVEAVLLQDTHPALLTLRIGGRAQNAVIVVDAAAPEKCLLSVDKETLVGPGDLPDAECDFQLIPLAGGDSRRIEVGRFGAPEPCIGDGQFKIHALAGDAGDLHGNGDGRLDAHHGRGNGYSTDFDALRPQPLPLADVEPHWAVDTGTGIPAGVGQLRVVRCDGERIFSADGQILQFYKEAGVAVGVEGQLFAVQGDRGVLVDTLEFHKDILVSPLRRSGKGFFICVYPAREIAVPAVGNIRAALFRDLRIVRQGDGAAVTEPAAVE